MKKVMFLKQTEKIPLSRDTLGTFMQVHLLTPSWSLFGPERHHRVMGEGPVAIFSVFSNGMPLTYTKSHQNLSTVQFPSQMHAQDKGPHPTHPCAYFPAAATVVSRDAPIPL